MALALSPCQVSRCQRSSWQHVDDCIWLTRHDFLL